MRVEEVQEVPEVQEVQKVSKGWWVSMSSPSPCERASPDFSGDGVRLFNMFKKFKRFKRLDGYVPLLLWGRVGDEVFKRFLKFKTPIGSDNFERSLFSY